METKLLRLQKVIADCGITSRRKAEVLITGGRVKVNNIQVTTLGTKVNPHEDVVMVDGDIIDLMHVDHIYVLLNKPRCYMTTVSDPEGRKTVLDLVEPIAKKKRIYPVGRLDYLSEGLLLLTNDGEIANKIVHPRYGVEKIYEVKVFGKVNDQILKKLKKGIVAEDGHLKPKSVRVIEQLPNKTWLEFRLTEGKNREIRRLCEAVDLTIDKLRRVAIEGLSIEGMQPGDYSILTKSELLNGIGMNVDGTRKGHVKSYVSSKKSVDIKKKFRLGKAGKLADSKDFKVYRKEAYNTTIKSQKEVQEKIAIKKQLEKEFGANYTVKK